MKPSLTLVLITTAFLSFHYCPAQDGARKIVGEWISSKKDSKILIYETSEKFSGKITWGTGGTTIDEKNPDPALRKRELVGLVILRDFIFNPSDGNWTDGTIYDPREGKTYSCKMTLVNANTLSIRGYVGISLFGRTDTWTRVQ